MRLLALVPLALVGTCLLAAPAQARNVYLNGTKIDGLTGQTFERCRVRFDDKGDIHIQVEGVNVQVVQTEGRPGVGPVTPAVPSAPVGHRYFLEASQFRVGLAQFDVEVHVNGKTVAVFRGDRPQGAVEVTSFLRAGENKVLFIANKIGGVRRSTSRRDYVRVNLFKGSVQGDNVLVSSVLRTFERTAAHTASTAEEHRVTAD